MTDLKINNFNECQQCGDCCKNPCDLIPSDLPPLFEHFDMSLPQFFRKYLIALIIASPEYADEVLMMVPVRVDSTGNRTEKFLADSEYLNTQGKCIFLRENKCNINELKPFGGRFLQCPKITGSVSIQLYKKQYFAYWVNNQHLFELIFPGFAEIFDELSKIFQKRNTIMATQRPSAEYDQLGQERAKIITQKLFPLFNGSGPNEGTSILYD